MKLRPYQQRGVDELRAAIAAGHKRILYVLPTGGGKTPVIGFIVQGASARGHSSFTLAHRKELIRQISQKLHAFGVQHGIIAPGNAHTRQPTQVASVQTLVRRMVTPLGQFLKPALLNLDEAHHAVAGQWEKILKQYPDAIVIGVTATPERADGKGLGVQAGGPFEVMVLGPTIRELIDDGYLCEPVVYGPPSGIDLSGVRMKGADFDMGEVTARIDKPKITGSAVDHYRKICAGVPAIVYCASVKHAQHVAAEFCAAGFRFAAVDGDMPDTARDGALHGLATGRLHGVTSCDLISEGLDVPAVIAIINLRPTQSLGLALQQWGRGLRPIYADGFDLETREGRLASIAASVKPHAIILDHVGNWSRHGLPDAERTWSLDGRAKKARAQSAAATVPIRQCPKCFSVHRPAPRCTACGHEYEVGRKVEQIDGQLVQITPALHERMQQAIQQGRALRADKVANRREQLEKLAERKGYKPGWVDAVIAGQERKLDDNLRRKVLREASKQANDDPELEMQFAQAGGK